MTDRVADMLTRIRNAISGERSTVLVPYTGLCHACCGVLKSEGFIWDVEVVGNAGCQRDLLLTLKYGPNGERVLSHLRRVSKCGNRVFSAKDALGRVRRGTGIQILSTAKGVVSHRRAISLGVGGEVLAEIW